MELAALQLVVLSLPRAPAVLLRSVTLLALVPLLSGVNPSLFRSLSVACSSNCTGPGAQPAALGPASHGCSAVQVRAAPGSSPAYGPWLVLRGSRIQVAPGPAHHLPSRPPPAVVPTSCTPVNLARAARWRVASGVNTLRQHE